MQKIYGVAENMVILAGAFYGLSDNAPLPIASTHFLATYTNALISVPVTAVTTFLFINPLIHNVAHRIIQFERFGTGAKRVSYLSLGVGVGLGITTSRIFRICWGSAMGFIGYECTAASLRHLAFCVNHCADTTTAKVAIVAGAVLGACAFPAVAISWGWGAVSTFFGGMASMGMGATIARNLVR